MSFDVCWMTKLFNRLASRITTLLPVYHIPDDRERRLLAAAYQEALSQPEGSSFTNSLATRFGVTADEIQTILPRANRTLSKVIQEEFEAGELARLTVGYLPGEV